MRNFAVEIGINYFSKNMDKQNFVSIEGLSREKILYLIEMAQEFEKFPNRELLKGKVVATLFFEPSTRTRLSFCYCCQQTWRPRYRLCRPEGDERNERRNAERHYPHGEQLR